MKKNEVVIGIDPGKEGFITVMSSEKIQHFSMPKIGKEVDLNALSELILKISEDCAKKRAIVVIEDVHAIHGSAASATFTFGGICWALRMGFIMCGLPIILVAPKKWQKEMYEGIKVVENKKMMSIQAAKRLFPNQSLLRTPDCKKPDDNLTDSLLIAEYGRRHYL